MSNEPEKLQSQPQAAKIYNLDAALMRPPSPGRYWALWKQIEHSRRGINRFKVTQRVLGRVPKVSDMSEAELRKMIHVFESILRGGKKPNTNFAAGQQPGGVPPPAVHEDTRTDSRKDLPPPAMLLSPGAATSRAEPSEGLATEENSSRCSEWTTLETPAAALLSADCISARQKQAAGERRVLLQHAHDCLKAGMSQQAAAKVCGLSSAALSRLLNSVPGGGKLSPLAKCERLLGFPVEQLAPDQARGAQSLFAELAKMPSVQQELYRLYLLTIGSSSEYMGASRRTGSAALTLERFADSEQCPERLRERLRNGCQPKPLLQVIRRITAEIEQRHRGQRHYELYSIVGRRSLEIELEDGTREALPVGRTWVFDDMSTNWPFWFEAPAEAGVALGVKPLVERHGCGLGRQGLYGWDWGSAAWLGLELVGRVRDAYTADIILRFFRRLMQTYGKPDTIVLEQSVWKARSIDGFTVLNHEIAEEKYQRPGMEDGEKALLQDGLRALGIRLMYTWTPRGKPIEGGFQQVQTAFPTFCTPGEGVNIGRYAGEFERGAVAMRRAGDGVRHPKELGFLHIQRHADLSWETMQWLNQRNTGARAGKPAELLARALQESPLPRLTERDLACFLPDLRELQIRGGHVWPTVEGNALAFIHPEHFAELGNGYLVSVKFDPAEPLLGAAIYNRDLSSRNHRGYAAGQFICWATLHQDAPVISLRDRGEDEGRQLIARYRRFHRTEYRALNLPRQQTVQVSERRDGAGQVATVERGVNPKPEIRNPKEVRSPNAEFGVSGPRVESPARVVKDSIAEMFGG